MYEHDDADEQADPGDVAADLKRALRRLTWATLVLFAFAVALLTVGYVINSERIDDNTATAARATQALCELRRGIDERIDGAVAFLRKHPNGIAGISRSEILAGIERDRASRHRLEAVDCPVDEGR